MPSRNRSVNCCELASLWPKETGPASFADRSDMLYASTPQRFFIVPVHWTSGPSIALGAPFCPALPRERLRHSCCATTPDYRRLVTRKMRLLLEKIRYAS